MALEHRLYVGNLPLSATEGDLQSKFEKYGIVVSVSIPTDEITGRSKRFGYVEMSNETDVQSAINRLSMTQFDEATISVTRAK